MRWMSLFFGVIVVGGTGAQEPSSMAALRRLDGRVTGVIIGLHRVTLAVVSPEKVATYLHIPLEDFPEWVRPGTVITAFYRVQGGSFWAERIVPYRPPILVKPVRRRSPSPLTQTAPPQRSNGPTRWRFYRPLSRRLTGERSPFSLSFRRQIEEEIRRLLPHYAAAVRFFNPRLSEAMTNRIAESILRSSIRHHVDPRLVVAIIACESGFRPDAIGKKGEIGLGQLMPSTAMEVGVDPFDPIQNIEGCVRYLRRQMMRFGSLELAIAAYNAGPNAVIQAGGIPQNGITPRYVQKVLSLYRKLCGEE